MSRNQAQGRADSQRSGAGWQGTRRQALQAGALTAMGFGLPQLFARQAGAATRVMTDAGVAAGSAAKARSCILIFMWG